MTPDAPYWLSRLELLEHRVSQVEAKLFPPPPSPEALAIYEAYPRKVARPAALKAIQRLLSVGVSPEMLLTKTKAYAAARSSHAGDAGFIPHPATWFNQHRYQDSPDTWVPAQQVRQDPRVLKAELASAKEAYRMACKGQEQQELLHKINNLQTRLAQAG